MNKIFKKLKSILSEDTSRQHKAEDRQQTGLSEVIEVVKIMMAGKKCFYDLGMYDDGIFTSAYISIAQKQRFGISVMCEKESMNSKQLKKLFPDSSVIIDEKDLWRPYLIDWLFLNTGWFPDIIFIDVGSETESFILGSEKVREFLHPDFIIKTDNPDIIETLRRKGYEYSHDPIHQTYFLRYKAPTA